MREHPLERQNQLITVALPSRLNGVITTGVVTHLVVRQELPAPWRLFIKQVRLCMYEEQHFDMQVG